MSIDFKYLNQIALLTLDYQQNYYYLVLFVFGFVIINILKHSNCFCKSCILYYSNVYTYHLNWVFTVDCDWFYKNTSNIFIINCLFCILLGFVTLECKIECDNRKSNSIIDFTRIWSNAIEFNRLSCISMQ